jgi:hypothetical protein
MAKVKLGLDDSELRSGLKGAAQQLSTFQRQTVASFQGVSAAFAAFGGGAAFTGLITRGIEFNKNMADSEVAIGNVLRQFQGLNQEAAKAEAAKAMQQIVDLEPLVAGSLGDLTGGFMATIASAQAMGISVEDNITLVGLFANALANAKIPAEQLAQEMRSILTGNIGADSTLAKVLNITNEDVKNAKEAGELVDFLKNKIGLLGQAGDSAEVTFSSLNSAIDKALGAATKALFEQSVTGAKSLTEVINENQQAFADLGAGIGSVLSGAVSLIGGVDQAIRDLTDNTLNLTNTLMAIGGSLTGFSGIKNLFKSGDKAAPPEPEPTPMPPSQRASTLPGLAVAGVNPDDLLTSSLPGLAAATAPVGQSQIELREKQEMSNLMARLASPDGEVTTPQVAATNQQSGAASANANRSRYDAATLKALEENNKILATLAAY